MVKQTDNFSISAFLRQSLRRARTNRHEGQAMVEFALSIPFLIILLMVLVELGFMLRTHTNITAAVREGARVASAAGSTDPVDYPNLDANALMIGTLNIILSSNNDISKVISSTDALVSANPPVYGLVVYRAQNWLKGPNDGDNWNDTKWLPNTVRNWETVTCNLNVGCTRRATVNPVPAPPATAYYQQVFGFNATGSFSPQTLYDQKLPSGSPCAVSVCGSNGGGASGNQYVPLKTDSAAIREAKFAHNPWYPAFRRACDVPQGNADYTENARLNLGSIGIYNYFNSPASPDWLGVKINYKYRLQFLPGVMLTLTGAPTDPNGNFLQLGDRAIKMIEPPDYTITKQDCDQTGKPADPVAGTPAQQPSSRLTYRAFTRER